MLTVKPTNLHFVSLAVSCKINEYIHWLIADQHWLISRIQDKRIFLDLNSISNENVSSIVKWLKSVAKIRISSFLNKKVDIVITNRDNRTKKGLGSVVNSKIKRSTMMLAMASSMECSGSSSVFSIAAKWKMTVIKYSDVLSCMKKFPVVSTQVQSQTDRNCYKVRSLRPAFIKVEDHSRKFKPEFVEMKSFPYIDLNTEGTSSPFDTWYRENYDLKKREWKLKNVLDVS